jgi:predicted nucleic acid-binding Zn ribbon protein
MPRQSDWDDEWDDSSPVEDVDDDEPTVPCPYCSREIHEDSQRCPYCEQYISQEDARPSAKPWWLIAGVVLSLLVVCLWIISR